MPTYSEGFLQRLLEGSTLTIVFGSIGIALTVLGFKIFDWLLPKVDVELELAEKKNMPVAVVTSAVILGICHIIATVAR